MFLPQSRPQIAHLDHQVREKLAASLEHLFDRSSMQTGVDDLDFATLRKQITAHRQRPGVFARYFDLVFALKNGRLETAATLWRELAAMAGETPGLDVKPLAETAMGTDAERYARLMNASETKTLLAPPEPSHWEDFDSRVASALSLLMHADTAIADETNALLCEVIGAMPASEESEFGSVSSLILWGAIVMNLNRHRTMLGLVDGLVHESAHLLLFGYAAEKPLVLNSIDQRFSSPLRADPRPMDGVFHATFVCARRHLLYRRILDNGAAAVFGASDDTVRELVATQERRFADGAATIIAHGRLTEVGEEVMAAASTYMETAAV